MKKQIIHFTILSVFILGCKKSANEKDSQIPIDSIEISKPIVGEDFKIFLNRFSKDSIFQVSRVKFPLKVREWEDPETGMVQKIIVEKEYFKLDFTYPSDATTREFDRYTQKIKINDNKSVIEIRGLDNGIYTDFLFERINGNWILVSWNEQST